MHFSTRPAPSPGGEYAARRPRPPRAGSCSSNTLEVVEARTGTRTRRAPCRARPWRARHDRRHRDRNADRHARGSARPAVERRPPTCALGSPYLVQQLERALGRRPRGMREPPRTTGRSSSGRRRSAHRPGWRSRAACPRSAQIRFTGNCASRCSDCVQVASSVTGSTAGCIAAPAPAARARRPRPAPSRRLARDLAAPSLGRELADHVDSPQLLPRSGVDGFARRGGVTARRGLRRLDRPSGRELREQRLLADPVVLLPTHERGAVQPGH